MTSKIQKWGNSQGIRIPKYLLDALGWSDVEEIIIHAEQNRIVIEKAVPQKHLKIDELFENYTGDYQPNEIDWGETKGEEVW